jgi:signal transduction histidine kinase
MFIDNFFTSGWHFKKAERDLMSKFQMMNVGILLSSIAVLYGSILNILEGEYYTLAAIEFLLFIVNIFLALLLRKDKKYYDFVSIMVTAQFTFLLILLIYVSSPQEMKHTWFYTYPIIILYLKNEKQALPWFMLLISMILFAPFNPFFHTAYSFFQLFYISFVLVVVSTIVYFYKVRIDQARHLIISQEKQLSKKVEELTQKDRLLSIQSRQAVMGEMISMIAHQWRQPLSTVTLSISNLQVKKLLGEKIEEPEYDETFENISETILYLSQTIDDFQTYFRPGKEITTIDIRELMHKVITFIEPRLKKTDVTIEFRAEGAIIIDTYVNELIQVLLNIVNNAVDELHDREIKDAKVKITLHERESEVAIDIIDNAGGIAKEYIDQIFEPYFSTKGKNGTGLGLYMSQMIMQKQFHTKIDVKSSSKGSIFTIVVPKKLA